MSAEIQDEQRPASAYSGELHGAASTAPPLGAKPRWLHDEARMLVLAESLVRALRNGPVKEQAEKLHGWAEEMEQTLWRYVSERRVTASRSPAARTQTDDRSTADAGPVRGRRA